MSHLWIALKSVVFKENIETCGPISKHGGWVCLKDRPLFEGGTEDILLFEDLLLTLKNYLVQIQHQGTVIFTAKVAHQYWAGTSAAWLQRVP